MARVWEAIRQNYVRLTSDLEMSVLNYLHNMEVLTDDEQEMLVVIESPITARHALLRVLYRKPYDDQQQFVIALEESGQIHLANAIRQSLTSPPSKGKPNSNHYQKIENEICEPSTVS